MTTLNGHIHPCAAKGNLVFNASASTPCADVTQPTIRCCVRFITLVQTNDSKEDHECSTNAEILSHRCQKSVQLTLGLALLTITVFSVRMRFSSVQKTRLARAA